MTTELYRESQILANRLALTHKIVMRWMRANNLNNICDLIKHYPTLNHSEAMMQAADDIWQFGMQS